MIYVQVATAATNGAVVIWKLDLSSKSKQHHVFSEHSRTVNKVELDEIMFKIFCFLINLKQYLLKTILKPFL